jgi:adenine-specific DNA-methyltransferase
VLARPTWRPTLSRVPDGRKSNGVHYTPAELAGFLSEEALALSAPRRPLRVLDPACGNGSLLLALARASGGQRVTEMRVLGLDQDAEALRVAQRALAALPLAGIELRQADFLAGAELEPAGFDLIIANPPYVRTQVLGAERSRQLARAHGLSGRVDLFHAFVQAITGQLRHGGVLALLCSNRTQAGEAVRALLRRDYRLHSITDLGDTKLFRAAVLPAVVIARRQPAPSPGPCRFTRVYTAPGPSDGAPAMPSAIQAIRTGIAARSPSAATGTPSSGACSTAPSGRRTRGDSRGQRMPPGWRSSSGTGPDRSRMSPGSGSGSRPPATASSSGTTGPHCRATCAPKPSCSTRC